MRKGSRATPLRRWLLAGQLALCWLLGVCLQATEPDFYRLEHFTTEDGLSQDWVLRILQDRDGFLWLATDDGLNRFDGLNFKVYQHDPEDPHSLSDSFVIVPFEDHEGVLWVGTRTGLNRFDRFTERFERFVHDPEREDSLSNNFITAIEEDIEGNLWVGTFGELHRFNRETGGFTRFPMDRSKGGGPLRLHTSGTGDLWVGGPGEVLHRFDSNEERFEAFSLGDDGRRGASVWVVTEDDQGMFWVGTNQGDVIRFDPEGGGDLRRYPLSESGLAFVQDILPWHDGNLWVGTEDTGLWVLDPESGDFEIFRHRPGDPGSLSEDRVMNFYEDRTGVIWIATGAGLDKLDPSRLRFSHYRHRSDDPNSLIADWISLVTEDRGGDLWVGSGSLGINRIDRTTGQNTHYLHDPEVPGSLVDDNVMAMLEDSTGRHWFGTHRGIDRLGEDGKTFEHATLATEFSGEIITGWVYEIAESEPGILWFAGHQGVNRIDTRSKEAVLFRHDPKHPEGLGEESAYDLEIDQAGDLWVATRGSGVFLLENPDEALPGASFRSFVHDESDPQSLSSDQASVVFEDSAGRLWVGTLGGGLNQADLATVKSTGKASFTRYRMKDGLPNDYILAILEDDSGHLWLSSHRGLTRLDPRTGESKTYGPEDGLQSTAFLLGSAGKASNGELFFGGKAGLNGFFPEELVDDPHPPQVAITDFRLFNRSLPLAERGGATSAEEPLRLTLSHRDSIFGLEFGALHFAKPSKNRHAYRLEGFNDEWIETDASNRVAQYTNLDPGEYVFRVKAANADGLWGEDTAAVRLTVQPAPWQTWWAKTLYSLAVLGLILAYRQRQRQKVAKERAIAGRERAANRRLREADRLKDEFLANTSHELKTPLYGITGLAESLLDGAAGEVSEPMRANLSMIVASGRRLSHLVNDILDFSKLRHKSLELNRRPVDLHALVDVVLTLSRPLVGEKALRLENGVNPGLPTVDGDENRSPANSAESGGQRHQVH